MFLGKCTSRLWIVAVLVFVSVFFVTTLQSAKAYENVKIEVLERADCAHCQAEKAFLNELKSTRNDIDVQFLDIADAKNLELFGQVAAKADLSQSTPITIVGINVVQGFNTPETTGKSLEALIEKNKNVSPQGFEAYLKADKATIAKAEQGGSVCDKNSTLCAPEKQTLFVTIPFMGTVDVAKYSLLALSSVLGLLDGFNPCAMWVLVTFLIVLIQIGSRKKMFVIAGLFILAEAIMYYLILNVWFKTWNFIGLDRVVTPVIGGLAIAGGLFFLYEWFKSLKTEMACQIIDAENRSKIVRRIKSFSEAPLTIISALGIIGLAFSVNVIEFACSIGYPQAFTKIIQINNLGFWQTQWYMAVYIFFYMIDDLIVFGLTLWGFNKIRLTQGLSKWSALIGGICMLLLGYLLIFYPEILRSLS
jgi:cytochrome c biogenesis protein CcdA